MMFLQVLMVFFTPIAGIILVVAMSTILDTCFGIWRAAKKGKRVTSKKARHGLIPKVISYVGACMLIYASDYFILNELTQMVVSIDFLSTKIIALVLISIEVKSIDESFEAVKGWSFLGRFSQLIRKAKDIKKELDEIN
jgi:peptidoglycan biosynthesis protein MviN/MurJ (putative lipid II flippase)